jgi:hypothetical protein
LYVHIGAESRIVGEIPAFVIRIVVDDDVVVSPIPIINVGEIEGSYAEVKSAEPETAGSSTAEAPYVARSETALEAAMLPGMVKVESGIATAIGVADPLVILVDVRSFGVRGFIAIRSARLISLARLSFLAWSLFARRGFPLRRSFGRAASRSRTARRNVSATDAVAASASVAAPCIVLRYCGQGKSQK